MQELSAGLVGESHKGVPFTLLTKYIIRPSIAKEFVGGWLRVMSYALHNSNPFCRAVRLEIVASRLPRQFEVASILTCDLFACVLIIYRHVFIVLFATLMHEITVESVWQSKCRSYEDF